MLVEGVHFTSDMSYVDIGKKAINCNISDVAAMGAIPKYCLITLAVSEVNVNTQN